MPILGPAPSFSAMAIGKEVDRLAFGDLCAFPGHVAEGFNGYLEEIFRSPAVDHSK
jgi:hypothetical protein